jgi:glyoxylase-like metal-dependent hydrolase (beta-lactamase superfamily II)/rhodanese-related sulfurtransferase
MIFRQLFDATSSTYTYLLADPSSQEAVLIDPVFEQAHRDIALLRELGLKLVATLDTHVHADHVTGAWLLRSELGSQILLSAVSGATGADRFLNHGDRVSFGPRYLEARATPGHTNGCMTFVLDDQTMAFTGDALLIRGCGRTDFQQGNPRSLFDSVHTQIFSLPDPCLLYPGHDYRGLTATSVGEEKRFNPRLGGHISPDDFALQMKNLGLPHPKLMAQAVPANLVCGNPGNKPLDLHADWAPLALTFAGVWEIAPEWVDDHRQDVQVIDVREPSEFAGPLGHIPGAKLIPLGDLEGRLAEVSRDTPAVVVCRAGARSTQGTVILRKAGYSRVANLAGGMIRWNAARLPVEAVVESSPIA